MRKTPIVFFILLLCMASLVCAVKITQVSTSTAGYELIYPKYFAVEQNKEFNLHVHLFNSSNGVVITNSSASCYVHLYNHNGAHTLEDEMGFDSNGQEFKYDIAAGNFSKLGEHSYIMWCNDSMHGGFISGNFEVTPTGKESDTDTTASLAAVIFIIFISLLLFYLGANIETEEKILSLIFKRCIFTLGIYLMMLNTTMVYALVQNANLPILNEIFRYLWLFGLIGYISMFYLTVKTFLDVMDMWNDKKDRVRSGDA